ncbi:hypothetical protein BJ741DRAFT_598087 [Chytriomyces cf. hyalinus JEL632]|nr:hypothetical protein BJ741DRAFT_598087 [Chytriomyces cf. hyalinus JEL632]
MSGTQRVLATVLHVASRASFSYPCCERCCRKMLPSGHPSNSHVTVTPPPANAPSNTVQVAISARLPLGDASSTTNTNSNTVVNTYSAQRQTTYACPICRVAVSETALSHRYAVSLVVSLASGAIRNVTVFGSSLLPAFGLSCTALHRALRRARHQNSYPSTQTGSYAVDSRLVLSLLSQVFENQPIILVLKNSTLAAMSELSDLMEHAMQLNTDTTIEAVPIAGITRKKRNASFLRQNDFVVSSVEFPTAPSLTVAQLLGFMPTQLQQQQSSRTDGLRLNHRSNNNITSVQSLAAGTMTNSSNSNPSSQIEASEPLVAFASDMRIALDTVDQIDPLTSEHSARRALISSAPLASPPRTPRRTLSVSVGVSPGFEHQSQFFENINPVASSSNALAPFHPEPDTQEIGTDEPIPEMAEISVCALFGIPSPPRNLQQEQQVEPPSTTSHQISQSFHTYENKISNSFNAGECIQRMENVPDVFDRFAAVAAEEEHQYYSNHVLVSDSPLAADSNPFESSRTIVNMLQPTREITLVAESPISSGEKVRTTRHISNWRSSIPGQLVNTPISCKNGFTQNLSAATESSPTFVADTPMSKSGNENQFLELEGSPTSPCLLFGSVRAKFQEQKDPSQPSLAIPPPMAVNTSFLPLQSPSQNTRNRRRGSGSKQTLLPTNKNAIHINEQLACEDGNLAESISGLTLEDLVDNTIHPFSAGSDQLRTAAFGSPKKRVRLGQDLNGQNANAKEGNFFFTQTQFNNAAASITGFQRFRPTGLTQLGTQRARSRRFEGFPHSANATGKIGFGTQSAPGILHFEGLNSLIDGFTGSLSVDEELEDVGDLSSTSDGTQADEVFGSQFFKSVAAKAAQMAGVHGRDVFECDEDW